MGLLVPPASALGAGPTQPEVATPERRRYGPYSFESSRPHKLIFPDAGVTKGALIDYYERVAKWILPHLTERPLVIQRFPDGVDAKGFYQKKAGGHAPDWVSTVRVDLATVERSQTLVVADNRATLGWLADQAAVTLHPWLSRTEDLDRPDTLVIDLDPPAGDFEAARRAAKRVRGLLEGELELACFPKLTGSEGIHVVVPLRVADDFDGVRAFARDAMDLLASRYPEELTTEHRKERRNGRLYLDTLRNSYGQTAVAPWSLRPLPGAPVAAPVTWEELSEETLGPQSYTIENVLQRLERRGDPWQGFRRRARSLGRPQQRLERLRS